MAKAAESFNQVFFVNVMNGAWPAQDGALGRKKSAAGTARRKSLLRLACLPGEDRLI